MKSVSKATPRSGFELKKRRTKQSGNTIRVKGAREHNLRDIDVEIPRDAFVVITGVSGSGKSTLAFDILYAEGQRRFLESMSAYARQFVEQLPRPEVDLVDGLPPSVSIEQRNSRGGGKSTVETVTEIHQFIRLLYARLGTQFCPECRTPVEPVTRDQLLDLIREKATRSAELQILAPLVRGRKGFHSGLADWARKNGYQQLRADGDIYDLDQPFRLDRFKEHDVEVVVGGATAGSSSDDVIEGVIEAALKIGKGTLYTLNDRGQLDVHSTERMCPQCQRSFERLDPKDFSYNSSRGWCPTCRGFGETFYVRENDRTSEEEAFEESWSRSQTGERETCSECSGGRLKESARSVTLVWEGGADRCGHSIVDLAKLSVDGAAGYFAALKLSPREGEIARDILPEIRERLKFLAEVGLGYLQLGRDVTTLSGGENQRIRLAAQLGSTLSGVLYVLDEPTIGLHVRDNDLLLQTLQRLRDRGNSLVVVEHDDDTIRRADHVIDLGPGAGVEGGRVVAAGTFRQLLAQKDSVTGNCLAHAVQFPLRGSRRPVKSVRDAGKTRSKRAQSECSWMVLSGANGNNLKNLEVAFPLNRLVVVSGVSGSGKSTLMRRCLLPELEVLSQASDRLRAESAGSSLKIDPNYRLGKVLEIDQTPIGRTPRSIPATYVGVFDLIRKLFAQLPEARMRGYGPGRFSFNNKSGRCPACEGAGVIKMEMAFLPTAFVHCDTCDGARYSSATLEVRYRGKHIGEVLDMSIAEAYELFDSFTAIRTALGALMDTGLGYLRLGQSSPTLSGGEAQRLKLVTHLLGGIKSDGARVTAGTKQHVFLLEEPTIGLHMLDVRRLLAVLQRLVDQGHSVIVVEHNLDVIAEADWVVDLGPEGGAAGGEIVVEGTPEQVAKHRKFHTGRYLQRFLSAAK